MAGNIFIPDDIEQFAKQLPAMQKKVDAILTDGQAMMAEGRIFLRELHEELTIIRGIRRKLLRDDA